MKQRRSALARLAVALWTAATVWAQSPLSLRDAVAEALAAHPSLAASAQRILVTQGFQTQAGLRPNPRLLFQHENIRPYAPPPIHYFVDTDTFAMLSQIFETSGKRQRRVAVAATEVRRAELERELLSRQIASRVKVAYWNAAGAQRIHQLLLETRGNFQRIIEYHEIRVREGAMAEADLLRVRLEGERIAAAVNTALLDRERTRIELQREMGRVAFPDLTLSDGLDSPLSPAVASDPAGAVEQRSEVKLARLAVDHASANLSLQQAYVTPNLDLVLGYKRTAGFNTAVGGVQVELPVSSRNQGNVAAASAAIKQAQSAAAATAALVRAEVTAATADYEIRRRQVTEVLRPMLDKAIESARIAEAAYREGGADLLRLLDAQRVRLETEVLYARTLAEWKQSVAALEHAMGLQP
jgi:outer membrane protein TolC